MDLLYGRNCDSRGGILSVEEEASWTDSDRVCSKSFKLQNTVARRNLQSLPYTTYCGASLMTSDTIRPMGVRRNRMTSRQAVQFRKQEGEARRQLNFRIFEHG